MTTSSDPFAGIPDTSSDYAGTELETAQERIAREAQAAAISAQQS